MYREQVERTEHPLVLGTISFALMASEITRTDEGFLPMHVSSSVFYCSDSGRKKCIENRFVAQNSLVCSRYDFFRLAASEITRTDEGARYNFFRLGGFRNLKKREHHCAVGRSNLIENGKLKADRGREILDWHE